MRHSRLAYSRLGYSRLAFTAAMLAVSTALAYAQTGPQGPGRGPDQQREPLRFSAEDDAAFTNARIAALKAGLQLTPEQEKNWPAVETALRENAKQRVARIQQFRSQRDAMRQSRQDFDPATRLRRAAEVMSARAAEMNRLADAVDPLAKSLDESQKRRLAALMRGGGEARWSNGAGNGSWRQR
ncbi:Spy/CpxP family protein refolding chaperone [Terrarubrum flagellatum]|uniref:Spy/CpxP family protein refolding chaperone n=1 Tax=Terrirubrum flagellatum TaxID=2895980 RepID=UPI003144E9BA